MKKIIPFFPVLALVLFLSLLSSCSGAAQQGNPAPAPASAEKTSPTLVQGYHDVDAAAFKNLIQSNPDAVVLDVRTPAEVAQGAIEGAINMDMKNPNFQDQVKTLDKGKTYLVYCRSGARSSAACQQMQRAGFENLYNLKGGILAWQAAQ
ncbi:MAG: rhodanese-like domain-containing protein [Saprospirales bacterium]|nr:rhodanese-like domain-containing protein [Saprospirales bacterium]